MNIYEKIMNVRNELLKLDIKKSGYNSYSKFYYYELKDFLSTATKMFNDKKLYSRFSLIPANQTEQETVKFTIINIENPEEQEVYILPSAECFIGVKKDGSGGADPIQNLGGRITYLRRYMYLIALDLIEEDVVDSKEQNYNKQTKQLNKQTNPHQPTPPAYTTEQEMFQIGVEKTKQAILSKLDRDEYKQYKVRVLQEMCKLYKVESFNDITVEDKTELDALKNHVASKIEIVKLEQKGDI